MSTTSSDQVRRRDSTGKLILVSVSLWIAACFPENSYGCECVGQMQSPTEALVSYDLVFEGLVTQIKLVDEDDKTPDPLTRVYGEKVEVTLLASRVWKGANERGVRLHTNAQATACGYSFSVGSHYLVFARSAGPTSQTSLCTPTKELRLATDEIRALGEPTMDYTSNSQPGHSVPRGRFSTVSESEWNITLVIENAGRARIIEESWNAGEYDAREVTETAATWSVQDKVLIVSYEGIEDRLEFTAALSLEELGMQGAAPGLRQLEPIDERSRLGGYSMWLEPLKPGAIAEPASAGKDSSSEDLVFTIKPEKDEITEDGPLVIQWELENKGSSPVYICQWPGPAFSFGWGLGEGKIKGVIPGYPSSRKLDRKFFLELKPGEALLGSSVVNVFGTDAGEVWIGGEFRSDQSGQEYGLQAWRGRVDSEKVRVMVPVRSTEQK